MSREEVKPVERFESDAEKDKFISEAESVVKKVNNSHFSDAISRFTALYSNTSYSHIFDAINRQSESRRVELIRGIKEMMKLNADNTLTLTHIFIFLRLFNYSGNQ